jgi:ABC-type transporter MlaC component
MRHTIRTSCYFLLALLVAVLTSPRLQIQAAPPDKADNAEVTKLLEDIELQSADLQRDADTVREVLRGQHGPAICGAGNLFSFVIGGLF